MKKNIIHRAGVIALLVASLIIPDKCYSKLSAWKSTDWSSAVNLTAVMNKKGITELSGLHWNPLLNRLYAIRDNGILHVLQFNPATKTFSQIGQITSLGGPEGIMQVDYKTNEFYTIDEQSYEIRRYTHSADFKTATLVHKWNLRNRPASMPETGSEGCEGIEFVPDRYLKAIGFISSVTGKTYVSTKGMGGLIFVAHQKKGYVWVFDVNPNKDGDYIFVGKYKTNRNESCDLAFDRSTGLLYILHNIGKNSVEVTDLSTETDSGKHRFIPTNEYRIPNPEDGNVNVEGFAITPKFADSAHVSVWLCRDVDKKERHSLKKDCLRWFTPSPADGTSFKNRK